MLAVAVAAIALGSAHSIARAESTIALLIVFSHCRRHLRRHRWSFKTKITVTTRTFSSQRESQPQPKAAAAALALISHRPTGTPLAHNTEVDAQRPPQNAREQFAPALTSCDAPMRCSIQRQICLRYKLTKRRSRHFFRVGGRFFGCI